MITHKDLFTIKNFVPEEHFDNPYLSSYLNFEKKAKHTCPICESPFEEFIDFAAHIEIAHANKLEEKKVQEALNPLEHLRNFYLPGDKHFPPLTIGKFFGDIVTSSNNQHALVNIIGKTGMGKSNASMYIGTKVSEYISEKLNKQNPNLNSTPLNYFSIDNVAIMKLDSIIPILEDLDQKQYNIIILDDIGASYSARDFQNKVNKNLNKIFQTFRDTNTLVILTMPDTFLIDKVMRKIAHFQIELVEKRHNEGITIGKLFQLVEDYRGHNKTYYHFIKDSQGTKYTRVLFKRIAPEMAEQYENKRKTIRQTMQDNAIQAILTNNSESEDESKVSDLPAYKKIAPEVDGLLTLSPQVSIRAIAEKLNVSKDTALRAKNYVIELRKEKR